MIECGLENQPTINHNYKDLHKTNVNENKIKVWLNVVVNHNHNHNHLGNVNDPFSIVMIYEV